MTESIPEIGPYEHRDVPGWAYRQRDQLRDAEEAALEFVEHYTRSDGTLPWRTSWLGLDGSDDPYEAFQGLPMLFLLGGGDRLLALARRQWEAVTWQWTEYGQLHREYDGSYDWMHHGEADNLFRLLALCDPTGFRERQRAVRFADFYTGADPTACNYDVRRRLIRSPLTGSRGPRFVVTGEDWETHRSVLDGYPPPFEDLPGVDGPLCPWTDDTVYAAILERMNERMNCGDVPLNLTATSLVTHAYMATGDDRFRSWVLSYVDAWRERAERNGGIVPDNVGLDDVIGQYIGGAWWGGYYGWRWPHGASQLLEAVTIGCINATLLSGDTTDDGPLGFIRNQLDALWELGHDDPATGQRLVPYRHLDAGWTDYRPCDPRLPIACWLLSYDEEDAERARRAAGPTMTWGNPVARAVKGNGAANTEHWFAFVRGTRPTDDYPARILEADRELMSARLAALRTDDGDPAEWDIHHWQNASPVFAEGLVQTMLGAPLHLYHGGLQHATVRYFDAERERAGLPPDTAALVSRLDRGGADVELVHIGPHTSSERVVLIQAGSFAEHQIVRAMPLSRHGSPPVGPPIDVGGPWLRVRLAPGSVVRLRLELRRLARSPSYDTPWVRCQCLPPLLKHAPMRVP